MVIFAINLSKVPYGSVPSRHIDSSGEHPSYLCPSFISSSLTPNPSTPSSSIPTPLLIKGTFLESLNLLLVLFLIPLQGNIWFNILDLMLPYYLILHLSQLPHTTYPLLSLANFPLLPSVTSSILCQVRPRCSFSPYPFSFRSTIVLYLSPTPLFSLSPLLIFLMPTLIYFLNPAPFCSHRPLPLSLVPTPFSSLSHALLSLRTTLVSSLSCNRLCSFRSTLVGPSMQPTHDYVVQPNATTLNQDVLVEEVRHDAIGKVIVRPMGKW